MPWMVSMLKTTVGQSMAMSLLGMPSMAILPPWHMLASMSRKACGLPDISRPTSKPSFMPSSCWASAMRLLADVDGQGRAHAAGQLQPVGIHVGDDHVAGAGMADHGGGHDADRPGAGDQHVFAQHGEVQRRVHRVAEGIENRLRCRGRWPGRGPRRWSSAAPGIRRRPRADSRRSPWCPCRGGGGRPGSCGSGRRPRAPRR